MIRMTTITNRRQPHGIARKSCSTITRHKENELRKSTSSLFLNALYWHQIFALDSAVVEVKEMFSSNGSHQTNAMYVTSWRNTLIKLTHQDETKKKAHDSQIVRAKENLELSHAGSSYR